MADVHLVGDLHDGDGCRGFSSAPGLAYYVAFLAREFGLDLPVKEFF